MAPPRKSAGRSIADVENDPERENRTVARAPNPMAAEVDPEAANSTQARAPNPLTGSRPKVRAKVAADPERENRTQARARAPEPDDDGSYHTGQNYQASDEEIAGSPSMSLEGDGLEALDPELGSSTRALPALEGEGEGAEGDESEAEGEGEGEGADDENATRAGPPLKLEIVGGPDSGKKRKFKGVRMVIGRTPGVDLLLTDQSVSRRHVELIYGDDGVMLKDLGSGNGTKVNGAKVAEKKLEHGDEIAIGKTKIRFVDEMAAFKKAREENEKKEADRKASAQKKAAAAAEQEGGEEEKVEGEEEKAGGEAEKAEGDAAAEGEEGAGEGEENADAKQKPERKPGARQRPVRTTRQAGGEGGFAARFKALPRPVRFGVVALVALVLSIFIAGIALRPPPPPPVDPARLLADQKMQDARNAAREGDFQRTAALVDEAEKLAPGIDKTRLGAQAKDELAIKNLLDEARAALDQKRFEDARKALAKAGRGSVKTEEARAKVAADIAAAEIVYKRAKLDELLSAGEVEAARALLGDLPVEMQAEPARAIADFERQLEDQKLSEAKDAKAAAAATAARKKAQREQEIQEAFVVVERKFGGGEWDRAASECTRVMDVFRADAEIYGRAKKLQGLIPNFGRNYEEGMKKFRQNALAQAARPLRTAWDQYQQMGLRANSYGQELQDKIGSSAVVAGKEALLRDDLVTAWQNFKLASKFDPNDTKARAGLDDVSSKAEDLFQLAYVVRDRDPREAARKFKIVVQVTDPGSSVHEKAKNQLAAMAP